MRKLYILDTNVLIHDPKAILNFEDNDVVLPIYVIEEIDKLKKESGNRGASARIVARFIDTLREKGSLAQGIEMEKGIFFRVEIEGDTMELPHSLKRDIVDNRILAVSLYIKNKEKKKKVILVSKDINMRIKADSLGLNVEDYNSDKMDLEELYTGNIEVEVDLETLKKYEKSGRIKYDEIMKEEPIVNSFITMNYKDKSASGRYNKDTKRIERMAFSDVSVWGIRGRNNEQEFALDLLMDENIKVVTLVGKAGTGKTLLAVASGLEQVVERSKYKKLFIARPIVAMGKDLGYLPGSEKEKLKPWMQPIFDNIDFLANAKEEKAGEKVIMGLESMGLLKIEALTYIRGRSIPEGFMIIDEAQNLTPHEIKTIVTRAGENTKIVFTGDPYQIDNPYLDAESNGLTYLAERFKNVEIAGHITLKKGERSKLAELAATLL
ncbi:MAG: PhoH family protein [Fusobacteria bacterium]|nr:MAG: PhoH family protein [Fusobacteriota bacterium]